MLWVVIAFTVFLLAGMPVAFAIGISGCIFFVQHPELPSTIPIQLTVSETQNFALLAVPLFILAAEFMNTGSLSDRLLTWCNAVVGRFRGGLAQVNVLQSIVFAGMSGSALADAAGTGKMIHSLMTRDGKYTSSFAAALTAASVGVVMPE